MKKQNGFIIILIILLLSGFLTCPIYNILGIPCPTCGMTRAWQSFLSGSFATAFSMHPLFLLPLLVFVPKLRKKWVLIAIWGIFILVYAIRMAVLFPHTAPMNYNFSSLLGGFFK